MKRTRININFKDFPQEFHPFLERAVVYDSSCSPEARVYFLDVDGGLYLKTSQKGSLKKEALMDDYFFKKGLSHVCGKSHRRMGGKVLGGKRRTESHGC